MTAKEEPLYPPTPIGIARLTDPETCRAAATYWKARSRRAREIGDVRGARIAAALADSFQEALAD